VLNSRVNWDAIDWGDVPTWVTAVAALLALIAAYVALKTYGFTKQQALMEQARLVAAWLDPRPVGQPGNLTVVNHSAMAVWDFTVHVVALPSETVIQVARTPVLPPTNKSDVGTTLHLGATGQAKATADTGAACVVWFRDRNNCRWMRTWQGELRIAKPPAEIATTPPYRLV
jgi:hypothetical protein